MTAPVLPWLLELRGGSFDGLLVSAAVKDPALVLFAWRHDLHCPGHVTADPDDPRLDGHSDIAAYQQVKRDAIYRVAIYEPAPRPVPDPTAAMVAEEPVPVGVRGQVRLS